MSSLLAAAMALTLAAPPDVEVDAVPKVRAAYAKAVNEPPSARGTGTYRGESDGQLWMEAEFSFVMDEPGHALDIRYLAARGNPPRYDRVTLVCDGTAIHSTRYSPRIRPVGCETSIYDYGMNEHIGATGMPFDPSKLVRTLLGTAEDFNGRQVEFDVLASGEIEGRYDLSEGFEVVFLADPKAGHNVVRVQGRPKGENDGAKAYSAVYSATWTKLHETWICTGLVRETTRDGKTARDEMKLKPLEVGVEIDPATLQPAALEPCASSRILDQRKNAVQRIIRR